MNTAAVTSSSSSSSSFPSPVAPLDKGSVSALVEATLDRAEFQRFAQTLRCEGKRDTRFPRESIDFQEFVRRLHRREQEEIQQAWRTIPNIRDRALLLLKIGRTEEEFCKNYRSSFWMEPGFDMILLYAMHHTMSDQPGGPLKAIEASTLFCYSQAARLSENQVGLHRLEESGEITTYEEEWVLDPAVKGRFAFFENIGEMPRGLPAGRRLFFSIDPEVYYKNEEKGDVEYELRKRVASANMKIFSSKLPLILPPAFLQGFSSKARVHPVLGVSSKLDFLNFFQRDVAIPSSFATAKTADTWKAPHAIAFYRHDMYHFLLDALNWHLDKHQKLYQVFAQRASDVRLCGRIGKLHKNFAELYLDREFTVRAVFQPHLQMPLDHEGMEYFKEFCFFVDLAAKMLCLDSLNGYKKLLDILSEELPKQFPALSLRKVLDDPRMPDLGDETVKMILADLADNL